MIRIALSERQVRGLEAVFRDTGDRKLRGRAQIVLTAHRGRPREQVAADLGVTTRTLRRRLNAYLEHGVEGLRPRKAPAGAAAKIPERLAGDVRRWVIGGPQARGLGRANWTYEEPAAHPARAHGVRVGRSAVHEFCRRHDVRPYRPAYRLLRGDEEKQAEAGDGRGGAGRAQKGAERGELTLLAQDEARFPMVPTPCATLGVKGHRPVAGTRDRKDLLRVFAGVDCVDGRPHTRTLESRARDLRAARLTGPEGRRRVGKTRRMTPALAAHLRDVAKAYPARRHARVVLAIDNAPWRRGKVVGEALAENPHLGLYRLPAHSPKLNVIERPWKVPRRRATHNRLFDTLADLKASLRNSLRYFQTVRSRITSLVEGCYANATASTGT